MRQQLTTILNNMNENNSEKQSNNKEDKIMKIDVYSKANNVHRSRSEYRKEKVKSKSNEIETTIIRTEIIDTVQK